jgi:hypothetical protein
VDPPASGRSENVGYSTGFAEVSPDATYFGSSGWENRFDWSMVVLPDEEFGRYASLLGVGRRSNRTAL